MTHLAHILLTRDGLLAARGDSDTDWVKIVLVLVGVLWWAVSAMIKAGKQKPSPPPSQWSPEDLPADWLTPTPPPPPMPAAAQQRRSQAKRASKRAPGVLAATLAPPMEPAKSVAAARLGDVKNAAPAATRVTGVDALLTRQNIKRNFVASTLFDPPPSADA